MRTSNNVVRKLDPKLRAASVREHKYNDRRYNLETPEQVRERSRERKHRPPRSVATYLEFAKRARLLRAGMLDALAVREELVPLDRLVG